MKIFPFFFGFISFNMPAGLVVYFAASQIFRIGQQALIINLDEKHAATAAEQAKEAKKNKPAAQPSQDSGSGGTTPATPGPKRRPQGSKKKRPITGKLASGGSHSRSGQPFSQSQLIFASPAYE